MQGFGPQNDNQGDMRNLILFIAISLLMWLSYDYFYVQPRLAAQNAAEQAQMQEEQERAARLGVTQAEMVIKRDRSDIINAQNEQRIAIENAEVKGSFSTKGGRIDDLLLKNYYKTLAKEENVDLLSPAGSKHPHYAEIGWISADPNIVVPNKNTIWQVEGAQKILSAEAPIVMRWQNEQGIAFYREYSLDDKYMISVDQRIENNSGRDLKFYPYALISRHGLPEPTKESKSGGIYEGPLGYINGDLKKFDFRKLVKKGDQNFPSASGWIGMAQKYWLVALLPEQNDSHGFRFTSQGGKLDLNKAVTQIDVRGGAVEVASGASGTYKAHIFAGAKVVKMLENYSEELGVKHFDLAVNFGMLYFITKPLYWLMTYFAGVFGNVGIAIICITILVRILVFPLANKSYRSFAGLRKISPMMQEIREKHGHDKDQLQKELVKLYEREKVNPMAGCLPILVQMPIFFAVFRVISMAIETRHAPFFGWIEDLSTKDPTSILNLFGLLPYDIPGFIPGFLNLGVWSCLMFIFMFLQQRLSPPPQDPQQKIMMMMMPIMFTFILASFPSGLVIYFTFSNALGVVQQYLIMRMMGVEVHLFKRTKAEKELEEAIEKGPIVHPELEVVAHEVEEALFGEDDDSKDDKKMKSDDDNDKEKK